MYKYTYKIALIATILTALFSVLSGCTSSNMRPTLLSTSTVIIPPASETLTADLTRDAINTLLTQVSAATPTYPVGIITPTSAATVSYDFDIAATATALATLLIKYDKTSIVLPKNIPTRLPH